MFSFDTEKEMVTSTPAKIGPKPFATLPPVVDRPLVVARSEAGTVRFVVIVMAAKYKHVNIFAVPMTMARKIKDDHLNSPSSCETLLLRRFAIGMRMVVETPSNAPID